MISWGCAGNTYLSGDPEGCILLRQDSGEASIRAAWAPVATACNPSAPSNLNVFQATDTQVNLSWTDNSNNEFNFIVQRSSTSSGPWQTVATLGVDTTTYQDTNGITCGATYYYQVEAYRQDANLGNYSNIASLTITCGPGTPGNLRLTTVLPSQVSLAWDASQAARISTVPDLQLWFAAR